ncbi:adenosylcobinamide amidohydrolase [Paenibacillus sp. M1]|uniref:Adenosylcobinamide amidohydrolase n=1 Tax=Paenibacillus haidiansis TaxID=1574488 RepID=A0ABU7VVU3_9BACL
MTTPFLQTGENGIHESEVWPGLKLVRGERHILLEAPGVMEALGSSVYGGGMTRIKRMVNIYVDKNYRCDDPGKDIEASLKTWGYPVLKTAGLLTAVRLRYASVMEEHCGDFAVFCCATAGVSNAARAGMRRTTFPAAASLAPGTINLLLAIDGRLTPGAMVNAVITATEAKTAALGDLGVHDAETGQAATGTTTDAVVLGVSQRPDWPLLHSYAGTATDLGGAVGRLVYAAVSESLRCAAAEARP